MARRVPLVVAAAAAALIGGAGPALGAPPTVERIQVDDTFPDEFLSEACGVDVVTTVRGRITTRTFDREGTGPVELTTVNLAITATADGRTFRLRDVGADLLRREPDGTLVVMVIGQLPFDFAGVLKFDPETGETILEPKDRSAKQLARACAVLTG